jgi:hypothetical protein
MAMEPLLIGEVEDLEAGVGEIWRPQPVSDRCCEPRNSQREFGWRTLGGMAGSNTSAIRTSPVG